MQNNDPFSQFKAVQKQGWSLFAPMESLTTPAAQRLVAFAEVKAGQRVLDAACGTGVVAITAARAGARVRAMDLTPALLERARANAELARTEVEFVEGDVEYLPYEDSSFDVVLSQFGHMFAPRPDVAVRELLRVLKPGGRIAFSTWPPDHFVGRLFALVSRHVPPPPGVAPTPQWGDPAIVRERLGAAVKDLTFDRNEIRVPVLSPEHARNMFENTIAPVRKLIGEIKDSPDKLATFRSELEELVKIYSRNNVLHQHYLMSRATKI